MLRLVKKIGFEARFDRDERVYSLSIDLKELKLDKEDEYTGLSSTVSLV